VSGVVVLCDRPKYDADFSFELAAFNKRIAELEKGAGSKSNDRDLKGDCNYPLAAD
jgi:hypothetical protein